jgi:hypothetical protein
MPFVYLKLHFYLFTLKFFTWYKLHIASKLWFYFAEEAAIPAWSVVVIVAVVIIIIGGALYGVMNHFVLGRVERGPYQ